MSGYIGAAPVPQATQHRQAFTATAAQTSFATAGYTSQFIDVYLNGIKLAGEDYTAANGSDVVLATGAAVGDILEYVAYTPFEVANQTFTGTTTTDVLTVTGAFTSKGIDDNAAAAALTLDAAGNVLFGDSPLSPQSLTTGGGVVIRPSLDLLVIARQDAEAAILNRTGTDGTILQLRKDGTTIGSIGSNNSSPYVTTANGGFRIAANGALQPADSIGAASNGLEDLGSSGARWKDAYLSGGVYLGGSAEANKLDDYEEGTWTPTITFGNTANGQTYGTRVGAFTKIGRTVTISCDITLSNKGTSTGAVKVTDLPFSSGGGGVFSPGALRLGTISFAGTPFALLNPSATTIDLGNTSDAGAPSNLTNASFSNGSRIMITMTYITG